MIGGNKTIHLLTKKVDSNALGEQVERWTKVDELKGFLDFSTGEANYANDAKIAQSTDVFLCDYKELSEDVNEENTRLLDIETNLVYDVLKIDDPMGMHKHLEIYLRLLGDNIEE